MTRRRAVFLDRDGVLVESGLRDGVPIPPPGVEQLRLLPGVIEAVDFFAQAGLVLVVVTNQPDVSRGILDLTELERMHRRLSDLLTLDAIYVCTHDDANGCPCRKPRPGMILQAAADLDLDLNHSVCVGDRWRDIDAAQRAGVHSVHIAWNDHEVLRTPADATFSSLYDAREAVIGLTLTDTRKRFAT
ncbi:MAG: histidinol-phosphate phosphatase family protein [Pseudonocardiales bacterium]|nr:histidinol-phosphate phosphatase family protein [Pseudonocardiales bacterium]